MRFFKKTVENLMENFKDNRIKRLIIYRQKLFEGEV
jgi:hypothetical protein